MRAPGPQSGRRDIYLEPLRLPVSLAPQKGADHPRDARVDRALGPVEFLLLAHCGLAQPGRDLPEIVRSFPRGLPVRDYRVYLPHHLARSEGPPLDPLSGLLADESHVSLDGIETEPSGVCGVDYCVPCEPPRLVVQDVLPAG